VNDPILNVRGLQKWFPVTKGLLRSHVADVKAVDGVDLAVGARETLGLVGESGCGKSTAARAMLKLLEPTGGTIEFDGRDITALTRKQMVPLRREMQMIFQDPYNSLNPRHTVGTIIAAPYEVQRVTPPGGVKNAVLDLMERVGLNPEHYNRYPNEFSGGQRQRIGIARAIALRPKVIIADEPVSALDVSIRAQVVNLLEDIKVEFGMSYIIIAHDLSVVRHVSDRVAVMYLGHVVEMADADDLYAHPRHPYTHALMSAVPMPDPDLEKSRGRVLLSGDLPSPANPPSGCVFRTRCWKAQDRCANEVPLLRELSPRHTAACHFPEEGASAIDIGPAAAGTVI
jgi:peptide/nickel transport system ATP-binding protein